MECGAHVPHDILIDFDFGKKDGTYRPLTPLCPPSLSLAYPHLSRDTSTSGWGEGDFLPIRWVGGEGGPVRKKKCESAQPPLTARGN